MIRFDLNDLVRDVAVLLKPQADERGLAFETALPDRPVWILADRDRVRQVLVNLSSNAVKYNRPNGSVTISIDPQPDHRVRIDVRDTGRGIPERDLSRIFDKFFRVADSEGYATGTGLGLSIVKQIVEAHGGKIEVQSQVDVGTTFTFSLKAID
jgi:two-component system phosphate regulon sensor histidine kinase PhoR